MTEQNSLLNLEFGLSQLSGNKELLFKMFDRFSNDYANVVDELKSSVKDNNFTDIRHKVHTIKGVAGNLGMNALYANCKDFEEAAKRNEADIGEYVPSFETVLSDTFAEISRCKEQEFGATNEQNGVNELKRLLEQNEFIAADTTEQLLQDSGIDTNVKNQIIEAINNLDYPTALGLL